MNLGPMRNVVEVEKVSTIYNRPSEGRNLLTLECGHVTTRKTSIPIPDRAHCWDCLVRACVFCGSGKSSCDSAKSKGKLACCPECRHPEFHKAPAPCRQSSQSETP
jgi:hypothetical protein